MNQPPDRTFSVEQPVQHVHGWAADERWAYTDKAGHAHRYEPGDGGHYPTLVVRTAHVPCNDDDCGCDGYEDRWRVCPHCGEVIRPAKRPTVYLLPGHPRYAVDGVPVDEAEYNRLLAEFTANTTEPRHVP